MITLTLCSSSSAPQPQHPRSPAQAQWSDVALAGDIAAAFFTVHAQDEPFFDWRWEDDPPRQAVSGGHGPHHGDLRLGRCTHGRRRS